MNLKSLNPIMLDPNSAPPLQSCSQTTIKPSPTLKVEEMQQKIRWSVSDSSRMANGMTHLVILSFKCSANAI